MSEKVFNAYSRYYDLIYQDKDYNRETVYIQSILNRFNIPSGELLEFGSGTGKHGSLLAESGYKVHGIELSKEMVDQSQIVEGFSCQHGDITTVKMHKKYDAVLSLFHVISYQTHNSQLQAVFANAAEHLKIGGLFIFDFWYSPAVCEQKPSVRVKRMSDGHIKITRIAEPNILPNHNQVNVNYTIFAENIISGEVETFQEIHPMRHFSMPEIDLLAQYHGFERIYDEEFLTSNKTSEKTWGVCVVLKRKFYE